MKSCGSSNNKKRGNNFTREEELVFLDEVFKYKNVIENKKTNNVSTSDKNEAWNKILIGFNSNNLHPRTLDQIKSKYDNLKTKARKWVADKKIDLKGTGGGPGANVVSDPVIEAVLNIRKSINEQLLQNGANEPGSSKQSSKYYLSDDDDVNYSQEQDLNCSGETLSNKVKLAVGQEITYENICNKENQTPQKTSRWNSYTTKMLKEPINKRLRPKVVNPIFSSKEEYYKKKKELIQVSIEDIQRKAKEETQKFEEERILASNREKREQEEYNKKMLLLDLQIQKAKNSIN
ncbi:hypothetical protein ABEB36_010593 [Hypothenemus hampei]|uniref:Regulatory protein zeste n=1 Tax=Hypothenemus hampei TaxID=57062 RepID=A0ABD1EEJ3_HYPHA